MLNGTIIEPWHNAPKQADGVFHGYHCKIIMHKRSKHYCGYVGVTEDHPFYGKTDEWNGECAVSNLLVHGGVTFTGQGYWDGADKNLWYIGFDCAHFWDRTAQHNGGIWRDIDYVKNEIENLAKQIKEAE